VGGWGVYKMDDKELEPFYKGETVLMRSKRISKKEVKKFYDIYNSSLPLNVWWSYLGKDYNNQIEYCKDADDNEAYYMFHTKYLGRIKDSIHLKKNASINQQHNLFYQKMFTVEWEARDNALMPGESLIRVQKHYLENLISLSKMTVVTKEEIVAEVINAPSNNDS